MFSSMQAVANHWLSYMVMASVEITGFTILIALCTWLFRGHKARFQYGLWLIALCKVILPSVIHFPLMHTSILPDHLQISGLVQGMTFGLEFTSDSLPSIGFYLFTFWLVVVFSLVCYSLWKNARFVLRLRNARQVPTAFIPAKMREHVLFGDRIRVFMISGLNTPISFGLIRPKIYLPAFMEGWEDTDIESVLLHELGHLRRKDLWVTLVQYIVQTCFFFHPVVWYINWQLSTSREQACDDFALANSSGTSREYGRTLLHFLEKPRGFSLTPVPTTHFFYHKQAMIRRINNIFQAKEGHMRKFTLPERSVVALLGMVAVVLSFNLPGNSFGLENAPAQQPGKVTGVITTDGRSMWVPGANITITRTDVNIDSVKTANQTGSGPTIPILLGAASDQRGSYTITDVPPGKYLLRVQMIGFEDDLWNIRVLPGQAVHVESVLKVAKGEIKEHESLRGE